MIKHFFQKTERKKESITHEVGLDLIIQQCVAMKLRRN